MTKQGATRVQRDRIEADSHVDDVRMSRSMLGQRIRHLRTSSGLTLRRLATNLGVSASALSMVENGQSGVSLQRLQRLADYFELSLVDLLTAPPPFARETPTVEIVRSVLSTTPGLERGKGVLYQLPAASGRRLLQPAFVSFAPGGGFANDKIGHAGEEVVYVLGGQVELHLGDSIHVLSQGDLAVFTSDTAHAFHNASKGGPATLMSVAAPPW